MRKLYTFLIISLLGCNSKPQENTQTEITNPQEPVAVDSSAYFDLSNFQKLVEKYESPERSDWQEPDFIIKKLQPIQGLTIADIGAGTGYFTFRLAEEGASVIAIDIDERFLDYIETRKTELLQSIDPSQISTRLSQENDPLLGQREVDVALLVNTYHFLNERIDYLKKIKTGLQKDGKLVIVDYQTGQMPVGPPEKYKVALDTAQQEIKNAGFEILEVDTKSLNYQYIVTAKQK